MEVKKLKFSRFNVWTAAKKQGCILYNSMTDALAVFEDPYIEQMKNALIKNNPSLVPKEFRNSFIEDGYLVEDREDELKKIKSMVKRRQEWTKEYFLSILLNLSCNFQCSYCFEKHTGEFLDDVGAKKIILMFSKIALNARRIAVDWYGGEPLLSFIQLKQLNDEFIQICYKNRVSYETSITTNGYLLNSAVIKYLTTTPVTHLQITLDGPPKTHNVSRPLKNKGPTFDVILENIKQVVDAGLEVVIRVNLMKQNVDYIYELFQILECNGLKNKIQVLLKPVVSSSANPCEENCLSGYVLGEEMLSIYKKAAEDGWIVFPRVDYLQCLGFCVAEFPNQFIIDCRANVYKCGELFTFREAVGKINNEGNLKLNYSKYNKWIRKNPLDYQECRDCNILPICMGGCSMKRWWKKIDCCEELKYNLPGFLEVMVLNQYNIEKRKEVMK